MFDLDLDERMSSSCSTEASQAPVSEFAVEAPKPKAMVATIDRYDLKETLGKGGYGKVKRAVDRETGDEVAIKILYNRNYQLYEDAKKYFKNETSEMVQALDHPNLVKLIAYSDGEFIWKKSSGRVYKAMFLVQELAKKGEIFDLLCHQSGGYSERVCRFYFRQLVDAIDHMHQAGLVHRDLKLENVFLDENFNLKLGDFGFTTAYGERGVCQDTLGTYAYMAPELKGKIPYSQYNGLQVDVFNCGVMLFMLLNAQLYNSAN